MKPIDDMTFDEMVTLVTEQAFSALVRGGTREMRTEIFGLMSSIYPVPGSKTDNPPRRRLGATPVKVPQALD